MKARKSNKKVSIVLVIVALITGTIVVTLSLGSPRVYHHVAVRTSPNFDKRPTSQALIDAASKGDVAKIKQLLDSGISSNAGSAGEEGKSALSTAAAANQVAVIELLLSKGADVNADDYWGGNALVAASVFGNVSAARVLIDHGADADMEDDGATALGYATQGAVDAKTSEERERFIEIAKMLRSVGARGFHWPPF